MRKNSKDTKKAFNLVQSQAKLFINMNNRKKMAIKRVQHIIPVKHE